jgi:hypothetical protein
MQTNNICHIIHYSSALTKLGAKALHARCEDNGQNKRPYRILAVTHVYILSSHKVRQFQNLRHWTG